MLIRHARPADAAAAVPLLHSSGPEAFNYVFCARAEDESLEFLDFAFRSGNGQFGCHNHLVACIGEEVSGIGACYGSESSFMFADARLILKFYGASHAAGVVRRGLQAGRIMPAPTNDEWMIAHLGVSNQRQGSGIGQQLIKQFLQHGQREHKSAAVLDVSMENPRAQALYERLGFTVTGEQESQLQSEYGRVPHHRRMRHLLK